MSSDAPSAEPKVKAGLLFFPDGIVRFRFDFAAGSRYGIIEQIMSQ